jgi:hypothetical protein
LVSQTLVAHTIELDNEAERLLPHRTTRGEPATQTRGAFWLVSYPLYANVLRHLEEGPLTVAGLRARARTGRLLLHGVRRWGYVRLRAPEGDPLRDPPQDGALVEPTKACVRALAVWRSLPPVIEARWRDRFGDSAVDALVAALGTAFGALAVAPPAYLPVISPTQGGALETPPDDASAPALGGTPSELSPLLAGVLWAFTRDVEATARISMAIGSNLLRVLDPGGIRVRDLPRLTGVSKEANAMSTGWLERHGCVVVEPDRGATRGKVVRLTPKGSAAQRTFARIVGETEVTWRGRLGAQTLSDLHTALDPLVGSGTLSDSRLAPCFDAPAGTWRAATTWPATLPHYPMVLHRGAYPDGS